MSKLYRTSGSIEEVDISGVFVLVLGKIFALRVS